MKPLLLKLVAFGPFASEEQVDFSRLGPHPLFLINGPTGAGKSSILDAFCFALYGETTGAERDATQMRCDFAKPDLLTEVTLDFALADKQYRVRRVPQQEKPKTRGEGTTNHAAEAQLWELDGSDEGKLLVAKKVNDATATIKELIGLDVEQFRQVMVLPQGKFRELLLADSRDREKIFSQLFQTSIYKQVEESLRSKASGIRQAVENHQNQISGILQAAEVNSEQEVADALLGLAPELATAQAAKEKADKDKQATELLKEQATQLSQRFSELAAKQTQLAVVKDQEADIKRQQQTLKQSLAARTIQPVYASAQSEAAAMTRLQQDHVISAEQVTSAEAALKVSTQTLETAKANAQGLDKLTKEAHKLEQLQPKGKQLEQASTDLDVANQAVETSTAQLTKTQQSLSDLDQEQDICANSLKALDGELSQLSTQQIALSELTTQLELRQQLEVARKQEAAEIQNEAAAQLHREDTRQAFEAAHESATRTEIAWHAGQAALLARELQDNQPCPVCGSLEHPTPAAGSSVVDKVAVDTARQAEAKARGVMDQAKENLDKVINQLTAILKDIQRLTTQLGPLAEESLNAVQETHNGLQVAVKQLLSKQKEQQQLLERIEAIKTNQLAMKAEVEATTQQRSQAREQQVKVHTLVDQLLTTIPEALREPTALNKKIEQVATLINQLKTALEAAEKNLADMRTESVRASSHHNALDKQIEEQGAQVRDTANALTTAINKSTFATEQEFLNAMLDEEEQESLNASIQQWQSDLDTLTGGVELLQQSIGEKSAPDLNAIQAILDGKKSIFQQADESWRALDARDKQLKGIQKKLIDAHKKNAALEAEYKVIGTLSEVANGQTGNKISLQRFVLSVLLDDVLIQASQRLTHMSKGRYQLVRKEDRAKGNKASGLELEVEDGYSGKTRAVATLSGGESFMAALSLALGLSDVVQSYAGGIKLDTLFIDEGFGSLDQESLDLAITTLIDLQATGRMIGIISHVSELKEQMHLRLDVMSGRDGSHISTIAV